MRRLAHRCLPRSVTIRSQVVPKTRSQMTRPDRAYPAAARHRQDHRKSAPSAIFARGQFLPESIAVANCSLNRASSLGLWNPIWVRSMWRSVSNVFSSARLAPGGSVSPVPMCQTPSAVGQAMY